MQLRTAFSASLLLGMARTGSSKFLRPDEDWRDGESLEGGVFVGLLVPGSLWVGMNQDAHDQPKSPVPNESWVKDF
jgi:hypothetical protein